VTSSLNANARLIHDWLLQTLTASLVAANAYSFKNRLKPFNEIKSKVLAKRNHPNPLLRKPNYQPSQVTDCSGFRIVSLFNGEIPIPLDALLSQVIAAPITKSKGHFSSDPVREVLFFTSRREGDPLSIFNRVLDVVKRHGLEPVFSSPKSVDEANHTSSYSSVHVIVSAEVGEDSSAVQAFSEIQLRSVFEEAWGEINHRLKYAPAKRERADGQVDDEVKIGNLFLHLDALKSLTDGCAQYADLINAEITERRNSLDSPRSPVSSESAHEALALFEGVNAEFRGLLQRAYTLRDEAESIAPEDDRSATAFFAAAGAFRVAIEAGKADGSLNAIPKGLIALTEELAYCLMFTKNEGALIEADSLFAEILTEDSANPSVLFRIGLLRRKLGDFEESLDFTGRALSIVDSHATEKNKRIEWVLCRDLAYICWRLVDQDSRRSDARQLLERAISISKRALDCAAGEYQWMNSAMNLLYYYWNVIEYTPSDSVEVVRQEGSDLLKIIHERTKRETLTLFELDSLERAEREFGKLEAAKLLASRVVEKLGQQYGVSEPRNHREKLKTMSLDDQDIYLYALAGC
jgi:ppGpp synthetase/RelA/SpoT-type nucleotidyltranferase